VRGDLTPTSNTGQRSAACASAVRASVTAYRPPRQKPGSRFGRLIGEVGIERNALLLDLTRPAPDSFWSLVERRARQEPVAYITAVGEKAKRSAACASAVRASVTAYRPPRQKPGSRFGTPAKAGVQLLLLSRRAGTFTY
jgi:hypothetical protein